MDGALLQQKIYGGYAKSALRVGLPFDVYRPSGSVNPLAIGNKIATVRAAFTVHSASQFSFDRPGLTDKSFFLTIHINWHLFR